MQGHDGHYVCTTDTKRNALWTWWFFVAVVTCVSRHGLESRTTTLKIKYHNFKQPKRSQSLPSPFSDLETLRSTGKRLLDSFDLEDKRIRLLGIGISNFESQGPGDRQLKLDY